MQALFIASAVVGVLGKLGEGEQAKTQYQAQSQADAYNAAIKRQRADNVTAIYGQREEEQRRMARFDAGRRQAAIAQSGTGSGGSNADIEAQSEVFAELDALDIRYEGILERKSLLDSASLDDFSMYSNLNSAKSATKMSYLGAAGAALSGAADITRMGRNRMPSTGGGGPAPNLYGLNGSYPTARVG